MKKIKRIGIIGRGAIGALYGYLLQQNDCEISFIVDETRKERYEKNPLVINEQMTSFCYVTEGEPLDLIMIATKYSGLHSALNQIEGFVDDETIVLSCLNGISSEEICRKRFGFDRVVRCIVQGMDSTYLNNTVDFSNVGEILFGAENEIQKESVTRLKDFFTEHAIPYRICEDIVREQWNKLMLNCGINQVCASYGTGYGGCQDGGPYQALFIQAMQEVLKVANAKGIDLRQEDIQAWVCLVNQLRAHGMPSMAQDILAKRKTELPLFSGTIVPLAKEMNIPVPTLTMLKEKIEELEEDF